MSQFDDDSPYAEEIHTREYRERLEAMSNEPKQAAVAYIEREDGRILCVWNKRYGGWSMPGGLVEEGETPVGAMVRELKEETGLDSLACMTMWTSPHIERQDNKDRASIVRLFYVSMWQGTPKETELGCPVTWLTREEFLKWSPFAAIYKPCFAENPPHRLDATDLLGLLKVVRAAKVVNEGILSGEIRVLLPSQKVLDGINALSDALERLP